MHQRLKNFPKLLVLVILLMASCSQDDADNKYSSRELLIRHNWIIFSVVREPGQIGEGEPDIMYHVLDFNETSYSGSDYTGQFYELGDWSLEDDILTFGGDTYQVIDLSSTKLVYVTPDEETVTRLAIDK